MRGSVLKRSDPSCRAVDPMRFRRAIVLVVLACALAACTTALGAVASSGEAAPVRAVRLSSGMDHTLAISSGGWLFAWGSNDCGQLGDGALGNQSAPKRIGAAGDWVSVAAGGLHSLALKSDGSVWAWGLNSSGQLGDGSAVGLSLIHI